MPRHPLNHVVRLLVGGLTALAVTALAPVALASPPVVTEQARPAGQTRPTAHGQTAADPTTAVDQVGDLQRGWRRSADRLWTLRGDRTGLHLLVADAKAAYTWRTMATLADPGFDTDQWVGNACLTRSGRFAVVVYAPRAFTNRADTFLRGGAVAVVNMQSGQVRKLPIRGTLSYYDPGCGAGEDAVLTQVRSGEESDQPTATRLVRVHAPSASVGGIVEKRGQYTSAVPTRRGIVAARGRAIVEIRGGRQERVLVRRAGNAFDLAVDRDGGITYLTGTKDANQASRITPGRTTPRVIALSRGSWLDVDRGTAGRVFLLRHGAALRSLGHGITLVDGDVSDEVSTHGQAMIVQKPMPSPGKQSAAWMRTRTRTRSSDPDGRDAVALSVKVLQTGKVIDFSFVGGTNPSSRIGSGLAERSDRSSSSRSARTAIVGTGESSATCAVPRNDPGSQVLQPTPRQVEWAADEAVVNNLQTARPTNWNQSGLPSWTPQAMFPSKSLTGGGRVPAQILLGVLAQESNLWQASNHALPGEFGNPLVGNYYGRSGNSWTIDFSKADCGYGVGQITDGMRKSSSLLTTNQKRAIALDYQTNIARALQMLQDKWNQTKSAGLIHSNADPASIENWIFAVWAYNTGFYANKGDGSPWGVGWFNNPANPSYPANRGFFNALPSDAAHPADWSYEEKVIGWAAYSISTPDGPGFRGAWWVDAAARENAEPPRSTFCDSSNACDPTTADPCPAWNSTCWWHKPVTYQRCEQGYCGNELLRFDTSYPEQPNGTNFPPDCTTNGLPVGSLIVDDLPASYPAATAGCGHPWTERGSFSLDFASPSARIDFHQIGGGRGGHFWFGHTRDSSDPSMAVTGTWTFDAPLHQWARVLVHVPDHGADTQQAAYHVSNGNGKTITRYVAQRVQENRWVSLGVVQFDGTPSISLSSQTWDGDGSDDVAWDAVALQPLPAKPADIVVGMGDSYSSGEGASNPDNGDDYDRESDYGGNYDKIVLPDGTKIDDRRRDACHRSPYAWSRQATLADDTYAIANREGAWDVDMDYHLVACSGAEAFNLLPYHAVPAGETPPTDARRLTGAGQYHEVSQIDAGYLDENTTLVTLSIGGNDAYFGPVIKDCAMPEGPLSDNCLESNTTGNGPNRTAVPDLIRTTVRDSVRRAVLQIHRYAPNAKILLMGYPKLISQDGNCASVGQISPEEAGWIDDMSFVMDNTLAEVTADLQTQNGVVIEPGSPLTDFEGKGVCGDPEHIHGIVLNHTSGDFHGDTPSSQSFHPTIDGAFDYVDAANRALRSLGE
jgi:hypothetical protein